MVAIQLLCITCFLIFSPLGRINHRSTNISVYPSEIRLQNDCQDSFDQLTKDEHWFERLIDPVFSSQAELDAKSHLYQQINTCLEENPAFLTTEHQILHDLIEYFLIFVGSQGFNPNQAMHHLIDPRTYQNKALDQISEEAGISPPDGYFYLILFSSREAMPDLVRRAFLDENISGVTILSRYIAILAEDNASFAGQILQSNTLPETISHEFTHAYINSLIEFEKQQSLPKWYTEGLAIYFSGSGKSHTAIEPGLKVIVTPPEEYALFYTVFRFLEAKLGRSHLLELIKLSIDQANPSILYQELEITSDEQLISNATAWKKQRDDLRMYGGLLIVSLIAGGVIIYFKRYPDMWCVNCDYGGKKAKFTNGICPRCGNPYEQRVEGDQSG